MKVFDSYFCAYEKNKGFKLLVGLGGFEPPISQSEAGRTIQTVLKALINNEVYIA